MWKWKKWLDGQRVRSREKQRERTRALVRDLGKEIEKLRRENGNEAIAVRIENLLTEWQALRDVVKKGEP